MSRNIYYIDRGEVKRSGTKNAVTNTNTTNIPSDTALLRGLIYDFIVASGETGVTDEEISLRFGLPGDVGRPRRNELVQSRLVASAGFRRPTRSGRTATVWRSLVLPKTTKAVKNSKTVNMTKSTAKVARSR